MLYPSDCCYGFSNLCYCRSLRNFGDWNEVIEIKGEYTRDIKTLATVDELKRNPAFRISVIQTRKINLSVINAWLQNRRELDELVIESLSKFTHLFGIVPFFDSLS